MSVRRRGNRWISQVYDPLAGRKVWVGTYTTRAEAKAAEAEAWQNVRKHRGRRRETVDSFALRWMDDYPRTRESTTASHRYWASRIAQDFKNRPLNDVDRVEARAYALKHRSVLHSVRAMFSDAVKDGLCDENPFKELGLEGSRGRRDLVVPTEEELGDLILKARELQGLYGEKVLGNFIQFGAFSGLRPGELYGLRWTDLDYEHNTINVERQWNQKVQQFTPTKTGRSRRIFFTPPAQEASKLLPALRAEIFSAPRGGLLSGTVISSYWRPIVRAVGRPEFTPHCLRHFYGTHLARMGMSAPDIAKQLGHTDGGGLALKTYIHTTDAEANDRIAAGFGATVRNLRAVESG